MLHQALEITKEHLEFPQPQVSFLHGVSRVQGDKNVAFVARLVALQQLKTLKLTFEDVKTYQHMKSNQMNNLYYPISSAPRISKQFLFLL